MMIFFVLLQYIVLLIKQNKQIAKMADVLKHFQFTSQYEFVHYYSSKHTNFRLSLYLKCDSERYNNYKDAWHSS